MVGGVYETNIMVGDVAWTSSTCQGAIFNVAEVAGMEKLPAMGGKINYNAGMSVVKSRGQALAVSAKVDTRSYVLSDAAIALAAGFSVYAATSSIMF